MRLILFLLAIIPEFITAQLSIQLYKPVLPADSVLVTNESTALIGGVVVNAGPSTILMMNNAPLELREGGVFLNEVDLKEGENRFVILAADGDDSFITRRFRIKRMASISAPEATQEPAPKGSVAQPAGTIQPPANASISIYAVIVGISDYSGTRGVESLKYAAKDAQAYYDFITSPMGGQADPQNVKLLLDKQADNVSILTHIRDMLLYATEDDVFIFYYSGHGFAIKNFTEFCLLSANLKSNDESEIQYAGVTQRQIQELLQEGRPRKKILFLDACNSGVMLNSGHKSAGPNPVTLLSAMEAAANTLTIISSSSGTELSYEDDELAGGHGVFTYYLIEGMSGEADRSKYGNRDNLTQLGELFEYTREKVNLRVLQTRKVNQRPDRLLGDGIDFPVSVVGDYDLTILRSAPPTPQPVVQPATLPVLETPKPSQEGVFVWKAPPSDTMFTAPDTENVLLNVMYRSSDGRDKFIISRHSSSDIRINGVIDGHIFNGAGKIKGLIIEFSDPEFEPGLTKGYVTLNSDLKAGEVVMQLQSGLALSKRVIRMGIAKHLPIVNRRFISQDGACSMVINRISNNNIEISGYFNDQIIFGRGIINGDVIEFVDNGKDFECSGKLILSDCWNSLNGKLEFSKEKKHQIKLELETEMPDFSLFNQHFTSLNPPITLSFWMHQNNHILFSGNIDGQFIESQGDKHGDVIIFEGDNPKKKGLLPGRLVVKNDGTLLLGKMLFQSGLGYNLRLEKN